MKTPIESCKNIGQTIADNLRKVGIVYKEDIERIGVTQIYKRLQKMNPRATWPVCYYLYSLDGALTNTHWDKIGKKRKAELLQSIDK